jgi:hypothetical protein
MPAAADVRGFNLWRHAATRAVLLACAAFRLYHVDLTERTRAIRRFRAGR